MNDQTTLEVPVDNDLPLEEPVEVQPEREVVVIEGSIPPPEKVRDEEEPMLPITILPGQPDPDKARKLLGIYTAGSMDVWQLSGSQKQTCRTHVMTALLGREASKKESGVNALRDALCEAAGIVGGTTADREVLLRAWGRGERPTKILRGGNTGNEVGIQPDANRTPRELQDVLDRLIYDLGINAPGWPDWTDRLAAVGLTPGDATEGKLVEARKNAERRLFEELRQKSDAAKAVTVPLMFLQPGEEFHVPDSVIGGKSYKGWRGFKLDDSGGDCFVRVQRDGKELRQAWSGKTMVVRGQSNGVAVLAEKSDNDSGKSDQSNSVEKNMNVTIPEHEGKLLLVGMGFDAAGWKPKRVEANLNRLNELVEDGATIPEGREELFEQISKAVAAGLKVSVAVAESNGHAPEIEDVKPKKVRKVKSPDKTPAEGRKTKKTKTKAKVKKARKAGASHNGFTPGTTFTRTYQGKDYKVTAIDEGYRWGGKTFSSLNILAMEITGRKKLSGPRFFSKSVVA